jgi:hypothetical protein
MQPQSPSAVSSHAKEILGQLIPIRQGYRAEAIVIEAFALALAFAAEAAKVDASELRPPSDCYNRPTPAAAETQTGDQQC